eukprot:6865281-Prorocentrum_lima.AAC.1
MDTPTGIGSTRSRMRTTLHAFQDALQRTSKGWASTQSTVVTGGFRQLLTEPSPTRKASRRASIGTVLDA